MEKNLPGKSAIGVAPNQGRGWATAVTRRRAAQTRPPQVGWPLAGFTVALYEGDPPTAMPITSNGSTLTWPGRGVARSVGFRRLATGSTSRFWSRSSSPPSENTKGQRLVSLGRHAPRGVSRPGAIHLRRRGPKLRNPQNKAATSCVICVGSRRLYFRAPFTSHCGVATCACEKEVTRRQ